MFFALGLWSITTVESTFLAIWFVDQVLEMIAAGAVIALIRSHQTPGTDIRATKSSGKVVLGD